MPSPVFTPAEVVEIRHQQSRGRLDVRLWADAKRCSMETVRRIARGDTYRHTAGIKAHPAYGGLQGPQGLAQSFVPPAELPPLDINQEDDEAAAAASLARLQAALAAPVPGDPQASAAHQLLDEIQARAEGPTR